MEYNGQCYQTCPHGTYQDETDSFKNKCKCELEKCRTCPQEALVLNLCEKCHTGFYPMENDIKFKGKYFECYKEIHGYYLDEINSIFKKCYKTCETCDKKGDDNNHNCLSCKSDFKYELNLSNHINCYTSCTEDPTYKYQFRHKCYEECPNEISKKSEKKEYYCEAVCPKDYPFDNGENVVIEQKGSTITITTTENQKNEKNSNMSTINLGICDDKIKEEYKIPKNQSLYIFKIDVKQEGFSTPKIEYEVYYPLFGNSLIKLNLTVCQDLKIDLSIPIILTGNLDKSNSSSGYYNDICYTYTSEDGTDISLADRKKEFVDNKMTSFGKSKKSKGNNKNKKEKQDSKINIGMENDLEENLL